MFNNLFEIKNKNLEHKNINDFLVFEINNTDYIGIINVTLYNLYFSVESTCNNINIKSACNYFDEDNFVILGTNLKNSFNNYRSYNDNDFLIFNDALGEVFQYKIKSIKRIDKLCNLLNYEGDLIMVIKDFYNLEYIFLICELFY